VDKRDERRWIGLASALVILTCACSAVGIAGVVWLARQVAAPSVMSSPPRLSYQAAGESLMWAPMAISTLSRRTARGSRP